MRDNSGIGFKKYTGELLLFLMLMVYIFLRAIFVPPLHDEVVTFFNYIETGNIINDSAVVDANNHLLNSFLSRLSYLLFGEQLWAYRLPNSLSFVVYFWSIVGILRVIKSNIIYWVALTALNSIPFVLEYFAMTRGYGLGMAFMLLSIYFLIRWIQHEKYLFLIICLAAAWLSAFANLIFINSYSLLIFYLVLVLLERRKLMKYSVLKINILIIGGATITFIPLVVFAFLLKNAGALYYGSLNGFWEVTGKSLSGHVFFSTNEIIKWILFILVSAITIWGIRYWIVHKWRKTLLSPAIILSFFFVGNIFVTLLLALLFKVNYPEDRAGIHFVFFFLLSLVFLLDHLSVQYFSVLLLFFPITFLWTLNFSKTIVTPDQALSSEFYHEIRRSLESGERIQMYPTQSLIWSYYERSQKDKIIVDVARKVDTIMEKVITRKPFYDPAQHFGFDAIGFDDLTADYILANRRKWNQSLALSSNFDGNYQPGRHLLSDYEIQHSSVIDIHLNSEVHLEGENYVIFEIKCFDQKGQQVCFKYIPMGWYYGINRLAYSMEYNTAVNSFDGEIKRVKVYLINNAEKEIYIRKSSIQFSILQQLTLD